MKKLIHIAFFIPLSFLFGQENLSLNDTTFDYQERFFQNGELKVSNTIVYVDSKYTYAYTLEQVQSQNIDTTNLIRFKHGLWREFYDKKWRERDSSKYYYYSLTEYNFGYPTGNMYRFNKKKEIVNVALRYPELGDSIFEGIRHITYHNGTISWIQYFRFSDDTLKGLYINLWGYYPDGSLKYYTISDDSNNNFYSVSYDAKGLCTYESKLNKNEAYIIKRKRNGRKEIIDKREDGIRIKTIKIDGVERRRKIK
ncbi:MAG TPA: hypothetical protein VL021_01045 [Brumimicrobium sp.]|nr:hypothetical protein [Brumimicrobium sp.]